MAKEKKIFWFDVETTGTDPKIHGIVQLAALIEVNNEIVDTFHAKMRIVSGKKVDPKALEVTGFTNDEVTAQFENPFNVFDRLQTFLGKHGTGFKEDRFIMAGYNPQFDCEFLFQWFQDISATKWEYWKYLQFSPIDVLPTLRAMRYAGIIDTIDTKLGTMCKHFGISIDAHDAMSDIVATRELTKYVFERLWTSWQGHPWHLLREFNNDEIVKLHIKKDEPVNG